MKSLVRIGALVVVAACGSSAFSEFAKQVEAPVPCQTAEECRVLKVRAEAYLHECRQAGKESCMREAEIHNRAYHFWNQATVKAVSPPSVAETPKPRAVATASVAPASATSAVDLDPAPEVPSDPVVLFTALSKMRPFNSQYIAFEGIANFVNYYAALDKRPEVVEPAAQVRKSIRIFNSYLALPTGIVQLNNLDYRRFKSLAKDGGPSGRLMALALLDIVRLSGALYQGFIIAQRSRLSPDDLRGMEQQVTPGGPEQTNLSDLNDLESSLERDWMHTK